MKRRFNRLSLLGLIGASFFFFSIGCTGVKNFLGLSKPADSTETIISRFLSDTRPQPGNPHSHYLLACYYQERGRHKEALEEFRKVLLIDPNYVKAYNGMGVSYDLLGDFSPAIEYYNYALKLDPTLGYVYNNLGYSYLLQGNFDDAIPALNKAVSINNQDKRFHNNLGLAYGEKGQYDLALAEFKLTSDEAKAHYYMAQLYFRKGLFGESKSHYAMALTLNPSLTVVRTALKAADVLARIFEPMPIKADPKQLVIPDQPMIGKEETEKLVTAHRSPEMMSIPGESVPSVDLAARNLKKEELLTSVQSIAKNDEPEKLTASNPSDMLSDPLSFQKANFEGIEKLYELQVASFRSKENAIHAARSIQELGYQTNISSGGNGNGDRWYRLITGPYETKDEALSHKVKIEKEYQFSPIVTKTASVKPELEKTLTSKLIAEKEKIVHLKDVSIEISNGNGVNRMAKKIGDYLKEKGLKVTRLTNANNFNHSGTRIFYRKEYDEAADQVAGQLPVVRSKEETEKFDRPNIKIKILIGKDLIPHHKAFQNSKNS